MGNSGRQELGHSNRPSQHKIGIFAGDSIFAYLMAYKLINTLDVEQINISNYSGRSLKRILSIFKQTSYQYFLYRSFVQFLSKMFFKYSIQKLAIKKNIPLNFISNKKDIIRLNKKIYDVSIAFNFDIIIPSEFINSNRYGILNIHAGNIPYDKGISPVVWAFCRGDNEIWISFYFMDGGIDTGLVVEKKCMKVDKDWSLFRTYCEVMLLSSDTILHLAQTVSTVQKQEGYESAKPAPGESYNSWPNKSLHKKMTTTNRSYFNFRDLAYLIKILNLITVK